MGSFTIENAVGGVQILSSAPIDGNATTAGNSQEVTFDNIFITPDASSLTFSSTLNAELDFPADIQSFDFDLGIIDCNGDFNGESFIDDCGNCVGGSSEQQPCIELNPEIEITFSNNECNTISDIDTLTMGLRLYNGIEISRLCDKSIVERNAFKKLKNEKIIKIKDGILKVNENYMIKLNSILNFLINP